MELAARNSVPCPRLVRNDNVHAIPALEYVTGQIGGRFGSNSTQDSAADCLIRGSLPGTPLGTSVLTCPSAVQVEVKRPEPLISVAVARSSTIAGERRCNRAFPSMDAVAPKAPATGRTERIKF
jgi:hypothetical protein